jgi:hypothetical protein
MAERVAPALRLPAHRRDVGEVLDPPTLEWPPGGSTSRSEHLKDAAVGWCMRWNTGAVPRLDGWIRSMPRAALPQNTSGPRRLVAMVPV